MRNLIAISLLGVIPFIGACGLADTFSMEPRTQEEIMQDTVFTLADNVKEGTPVEAVANVPRDQLPEELSASLGETDQIVLTQRSNTVDPTAVVSLDRPLENTDTLVDLGLGVLGGFFPAVAAWEGVLGLLFKRKRTHYSNAIKSVNPAAGGNMDFKAAMHSLAAALGTVHSSPDTERVFEEDNIKKAKASLK